MAVPKGRVSLPAESGEEGRWRATTPPAVSRYRMRAPVPAPEPPPQSSNESGLPSEASSADPHSNANKRACNREIPLRPPSKAKRRLRFPSIDECWFRGIANLHPPRQNWPRYSKAGCSLEISPACCSPWFLIFDAVAINLIALESSVLLLELRDVRS